MAMLSAIVDAEAFISSSTESNQSIAEPPADAKHDVWLLLLPKSAASACAVRSGLQPTAGTAADILCARLCTSDAAKSVSQLQCLAVIHAIFVFGVSQFPILNS